MSEAGGHGNRRHPRCETVWPACLLRKIIWLGPVQFGQSSCSSSVDQLRPPNWAFCDGGLPNSPDLNPREGGREGVPPSLPLRSPPHSIDGGGGILFMFSVSLFTSLSLFVFAPQSSIGRARDTNMQRAMSRRHVSRRSKLPCAKIDPRLGIGWVHLRCVPHHERRRSFSP